VVELLLEQIWGGITLGKQVICPTTLIRRGTA
jgi:hypothetical protein